jgi:DNA-binding MarR family transcriptional regulator
MQDRSAPTNVIDAVLSASRALVAIAARSLAEVPGDVTLPQYRVLVVVASRGPQRATALAGELGVVGSSVTRLCDRLVAKGLITRGPAEGSRREIEISLTTSGRALIDAVTAARRRDVARLVSAIPAARRRTIVTVLGEVARAAGEVPEQTWSLGWPE